MQGCDNLVIVTDHKPLTKIFGSWTLDEISNSCLLCLKQRNLPWCFDIVHRPGKTNNAASRYLSYSNSPDMPVAIESALLASICNDAQEFGTIPWSLLARATDADASLGHILQLIEKGNASFNNKDLALMPLWPACGSFYAHDGVLLYQYRVVVRPPSATAYYSTFSCPSRDFHDGTTHSTYHLLARDVQTHSWRRE